MGVVAISGLTVDPSVDAGEFDVIDEACVPLLQALLPHGAAWPTDDDAVLTSLVRALSYAYTRVKKRCLDFLEELDPRTIYELLPDQERVWGLPDKCTQPTTLDGRRKALQGKMLGYLDPTPTNITAMAAALGITITVAEPVRRANMFTCTSPCNAPLYTRQWMFLWTVTTALAATNSVLECVLERITPDHTVMELIVTMIWTAQSTPASRSWVASCWSTLGGGFFCAVANSGIASGQVMTSPNGSSWTAHASASARQWSSLCCAPEISLLCAVAGDGTAAQQVMVSADGASWASKTAASARQWTSVCWSPQLLQLCAVSSDESVGGEVGQVMISSDGTTWNSHTAAYNLSWEAICWSPELSLFCCVASDDHSGSQIMTSPDGKTWTLRTAPSVQLWVAICWSSALRKFCAISQDGKAMTSADGASWSMSNIPSRFWDSICWSDQFQEFCMVSANGTAAQQVMTSADGETWVARTSTSDTASWSSVCSSPSKLCAVASTGDVMTYP